MSRKFLHSVLGPNVNITAMLVANLRARVAGKVTKGTLTPVYSMRYENARCCCLLTAVVLNMSYTLQRG